MTKKSNKYFWLPFEKGSNKISHVGIQLEQDIALPFFIYGEILEEYEQTNKIVLSSKAIALGILTTWYHAPPLVGDMQDLHRRYIKILYEILPNFEAKSLEDLILGLGAVIRKEVGYYNSFRALQAGTEILPESSLLKCDMTTDAWLAFEVGDTDGKDASFFFSIITDTFPLINIDGLPNRLLKHIIYFNYIARRFLNKNASEFYEGFGKLHIGNTKYFTDKIISLNKENKFYMDILGITKNSMPTNE